MRLMKLIALLPLFFASFNANAASSVLRIACDGDAAGAEVYINGKFKGECPLDLKVPEGKLKLRVQKAVDGQHDRVFEQEMRMSDGVVKKIEVQLGAAELNAAGKRQQQEQLARRRAEFKAQGIELSSENTFRDCADCPEMVAIPPGSFDMGSPSYEAGRRNDEGPLHRVTINQAFALGKTHITRGQFAAFVSATGYDAGSECLTSEGGKFEKRSGRNWRDPGFRQDDAHPVVCINWNDARAYAEWLAGKTGKSYRLPSEAEWEYAARAGTDTARYWGDSPDQACGYENVADETAKAQIPGASSWQVHNCTDGYAYTAPVGRFKPNAFGLYDMLGNARQWVEDSLHDNYNGAPADGSIWQGDGAKRVLRGGSCYNAPQFVRAAIRDRATPAFRVYFVGFRLARTLP